MALKRMTVRVLAGLSLWAGFGLTAQAQLPEVTATTAVQRMPRQAGVVVTTPTPDQLPQCRVEAIPNKADPKRPLGYVVRDPSGNPVRQFVSYDGKNYNIVAFYVNGVEAYREVFPPQAGEPHQYRWLGPNGTKWGLDKDGDGRIDEWVVMSPEELSQELLLSVMTKDVKRAEALAVTKANLDALGLPAAESQKLLGRAAMVGQRIAPAADSVKLTPDAKWVNVQLSAPQSTPKDAFGAEARDDLVLHKNGTILIQDGKDGKDTKTLQTGEMIQIGRAWKLVDGPATGAGEMSSGGPVIIDAIKDLVASLNKLDEEVPNPPTREALGAYNAKRAALLEQIVAKLPAVQQELWMKQLVDSLAGAAEADKPDSAYFKKLKEVVESQARGTNPALAAFSAFRLLQTEHAIDLANLTGGIDPVQDKWRAGLEKFAKDHAASDEAPEAILRLALSFEHLKDGEPKAKEWYAKLVKDYARYPHAAKAAGAIKRLESEGKPIELIGTNIGDGKPFNCARPGRVVIVFFCASWSQSLPDDAKKLQSIAKEYGPKGLEVVTICLDNDVRTAAETVTRFKIPGTHLHAPGGLDSSPLASAYGIQVAPHMFVVGKDGKIVNRSAQSATLEDDVKKLLP